MTPDPLSALQQALTGSPRLKGTTFLLGPRELARAGKPPRVTMVPIGGPLVPSEYKPNNDDGGNLTDAVILIGFHCWGVGKDYSGLWSLIGAVVLAVFDYREAADINIQHDRIEFEVGPDTAQEGFAATVYFRLRAVIADTPIPGTTGVGEIDSINITRGS